MSNEELSCELSACICKTCNSSKLRLTKIQKFNPHKDKIQMYLSTYQSYKSHKITQVQLPWLLEKLAPVNNHMLGFQLQIPDTIVFKEGKPSFIVMTIKDFISKISNQSKLHPVNISNTFLAHDRTITNHKQEKVSYSKFKIINKTVHSSFTPNEIQNDTGKLLPRVIYRYRKGHKEQNVKESTKIGSEYDFKSTFNITNRDNNWSKISVVQKYIRSWPFHTYIAEYYAPINDLRCQDQIIYNLETIRYDGQQNNKEEYCLNECTRVGFYINKLFGIVNAKLGNTQNECRVSV